MQLQTKQGKWLVKSPFNSTFAPLCFLEVLIEWLLCLGIKHYLLLIAPHKTVTLQLLKCSLIALQIILIARIIRSEVVDDNWNKLQTKKLQWIFMPFKH